MKQLSYETLREQNYSGYLLEDAPERVLQFGEGNFLRAFVDYFIDIMNEKAGFHSKAVLCQPIAAGLADKINAQQGLYTLYLRGFQDGKQISSRRVVSCVSRCLNPYSDFDALLSCAANPELRFIACNTTEAGIVYDPACRFEDRPASSYPAKLARFLYERFLKFGKEPGKGFVILSCELIDDNGRELERCVSEYARQWQLGQEFSDWIKEENIFCSTLVDRIVTGYPRAEALKLWEENGYQDDLLDTGEIFGFWVIEGPASLKEELPFEKAGLPVLITDNHKPYKQRKVRILNGAHTSFVLGAYLAGRDIVRDCMTDDVIRPFLEKTVYKEIIPTLTLPPEELKEFADAVMERFQNPFIDHALLSISLNSTSKWKARVLPSLKGYVEKFGRTPSCIAASFAFYLAFYRGCRLTENAMFGLRDGQEYEIRDDMDILKFFYENRHADAEALTHAVCANTRLWGEDLSAIPGFEAKASAYLYLTETEGAYAAMRRCVKERAEED